MRKGPDGAKDLQNLLGRWVERGVWVPPKQDQAFNQGGMFVLRGKEMLFAHYDPSAGAHADLERVLQIATEAASQ